MITFIKVQIPYVVSIISICCHDDWKDGVEKTCVCSYKTWNLTSQTMEHVLMSLLIKTCISACDFSNLN
jgi:hypothetical protein